MRTCAGCGSETENSENLIQKEWRIKMAGYINIIYVSVILSVVTVFFLTEDCKDKKKGFYSTSCN